MDTKLTPLLRLRSLLPLPMLAVAAVAVTFTLSGCGPGGRGPSSQPTGTGVGPGTSATGPGGTGGNRPSQHFIYDPATGTLKPVDKPTPGTGSYADTPQPAPSGATPGTTSGRPVPGKPTSTRPGPTPVAVAVPGKNARVVDAPVAPENPYAVPTTGPGSAVVPKATAVPPPNVRSTRVANTKVPPLPIHANAKPPGYIQTPPASPYTPPPTPTAVVTPAQVKPTPVKRPEIAYQPIDEKPLVEPTPPPASSSYSDFNPIPPPPFPASTVNKGGIATKGGSTSKMLRPASVSSRNLWSTDVRPKPAPPLPPVKPEDIKPSPEYNRPKAPGSNTSISNVAGSGTRRKKPTSSSGINKVASHSPSGETSSGGTPTRKTTGKPGGQRYSPVRYRPTPSYEGKPEKPKPEKPSKIPGPASSFIAPNPLPVTPTTNEPVRPPEPPPIAEGLKFKSNPVVPTQPVVEGEAFEVVFSLSPDSMGSDLATYSAATPQIDGREVTRSVQVEIPNMPDAQVVRQSPISQELLVAQPPIWKWKITPKKSGEMPITFELKTVSTEESVAPQVVNSYPRTVTVTEPAKPEQPAGSFPWFWFLLGSAGLGGAGAAWYFLFGQKPKGGSGKNNIEVR